jgi:hypothetical protein
MPTTKARILAVCAAAVLALPALGACGTYHDANQATYHDANHDTYHDANHDTYHDASAPDTDTALIVGDD